MLLLTGIISYNYTNTSYAKWSSSIESKNILKLSVKKKDYALEFAQDNVGQGGLEQITHTIDNTLQVDERFATEYRYRGGNSVVKNYVKFNNEVWRIIGIIPTEDTTGNVENRIKIIRDASFTNQMWNSTKDKTTSSYNNWTTATLNTYLNNDYYNALSTDAKNMIGTTKYYLGGYTSYPKITSDIMWQYERKNDANRTGYYYGTNPIMQNDANKKIAIMYASDYGYAASKECASVLYEYSEACVGPNNYLDKRELTWLLPQYSSFPDFAYYISDAGLINNGSYVSDSRVDYTMNFVRPVLTLSSNVKISGGTGTSSDPYKLSL